MKTFEGRFPVSIITRDMIKAISCNIFVLKRDRPTNITVSLSFISLFDCVTHSPICFPLHLFITGLSLELTFLTSFSRDSKEGLRFDIRCRCFIFFSAASCFPFAPHLFICAKVYTVKLHTSCSASNSLCESIKYKIHN